MNEELQRIFRLFTGFLLLASGIYLTKIANLGLAPWGVFHDGLDQATNQTIGFGFLTLIVGAVLLIISVLFLKTKPGVGTFLNILIIGPTIELLQYIHDEEISTLYIQVLVFLAGLVIMSFGRSLYISAEYGQGPRDGIFVGLARITPLEVKYIKPLIELIVFVTGWILGGAVGAGTVIIVLVSGYLVQLFFKMLGYNPKTSKQRLFFNFKKKESSAE